MHALKKISGTKTVLGAPFYRRKIRDYINIIFSTRRGDDNLSYGLFGSFFLVPF